jgi:pimeloyl-ACP methyl ester carboxylesterase
MTWLLLVLSIVLAGYAVGLSFGMNPSTPTDWLLNLRSVPHDDELEAEEPQTLVVLQHGLWRSASSLGRLERALLDHGYAVLNFSYPSTRGRVEAHAERLDRELDAWLAARAVRPDRIAFVGHSLGGLVIRRYLARDDAVDAWAVVMVATPQRGAVLAAKRKDVPGFGLLMGDDAALELVPGNPLYDQLGPVTAEHVGVVYGMKGNPDGWNPDIPGDDDGTVGVAEVSLPDADDSVGLRVGHTRISFDGDAIRQILTFLRRGRFARG